LEPLLNFIQTKIPWLIEHKYLFLFLGALIEGLNTMVLGGFLLSLKIVKFLPLFLVMVLGHTINGYFWYGIGFWGGATMLDKWGHQQKLSHEIIEKVTHYFNKFSGKAIIITKFTFSLEIATLILAGSLKYNIKEFSKYNFYGSFGWTIITLSIGYIFGQSFNFFKIFIKNLTYLLLFLGGAIAVILLFKVLAKRRFIKFLSLEQKLDELKQVFKEKLDNLLEDKDKKIKRYG